MGFGVVVCVCVCVCVCVIRYGGAPGGGGRLEVGVPCGVLRQEDGMGVSWFL
jgi:hypothetical protein